MKRKLILLLVLVLVVTVLGGCNKNNMPDGIENKKFFKDLSSTHGLIVHSMRDNKYDEEKINKSIDKLNKYVSNGKLNEYETLIVSTINDNIDDFKYDITQGDRGLQSVTLDNLWIIDVMSSYFKEKHNR